MDALPLASSLVLLWATVHFWLTSSDLRELCRWLGSLGQRRGEDGPVDEQKEARVAEEMKKMRERNYKLFSRCLCHVDLVIGIFYVYLVVATPTLDNITLATGCIVAYALFLMLGREMAHLSPNLVKFLTCLVHMLPVSVIFGTVWSGKPLMADMMRGFVAGRFCLVLIFLDPSVSIPFQFLYAAVDLYVNLYVLQSSEPVGELVSNQLFILAETIFSSVFVDRALRSRIYAQLENADAESLVSSFRRMLRGVCDGEVLLDHHFHVAQESECLRHLIMADVSLKGRSFEHFTEDPQHFRQLLRRRADPEAAPRGSRLCLRGAAGIRVGTDIFHVPIPGLYGAVEPHHLIAFKEDPEARAPPEAKEDAVPEELLPWDSRKRPECPELRDMFLLVNVETELQDVQQVELNFEHLPSALQSSMPSLRKLVRPTDWEKIRSRVEKTQMDPEFHAQALPGLRVHLPSLGWLSVEATLHRMAQTGKALLVLLSWAVPPLLLRRLLVGLLTVFGVWLLWWLASVQKQLTRKLEIYTFNITKKYVNGAHANKSID
ncbi:Uncharacterized protein SCF082_LOCUS48234 [Durusdinium trenchii]|uniref:Uncharacterized protein n=1 Tax=Durusdinium trenchii TaxID=1381693 RepID=A0ABP0RRH7_9DINO